MIKVVESISFLKRRVALIDPASAALADKKGREVFQLQGRNDPDIRGVVHQEVSHVFFVVIDQFFAPAPCLNDEALSRAVESRRTATFLEAA